MSSILKNNFPVVLIHGMFGFGPQEMGPLVYWETAMAAASPLTRIQSSVGPISSPHDRACELAAQLKGERVDFGAEHALAQGHERFGRDYSNRGLWPDWGEQNPVHLVGHSLGTTTGRALQYLLAQDYWGWGSTDRWIASLTSISGPLNGTTAIYFFGADTRTGLMQRGAGLTPLLHFLELYTAFSGSSLDQLYDFDLDHWGFSKRESESLNNYLQRIGRSQFLWGADNAFYSISLQSAYRDNARWPTYPDTYYFSYVSKCSMRFRAGGYHYPSPLMSARLQPTSWQIGRLGFKDSPFPDQSFASSDWWENDGLVPTFSQGFPHISGKHPRGGKITVEAPGSAFVPGRWYTQLEKGLDHAAILNPSRFWRKERVRRFYENLFTRLASLARYRLRF